MPEERTEVELKPRRVAVIIELKDEAKAKDVEEFLDLLNEILPTPIIKDVRIESFEEAIVKKEKAEKE